QKATQEVCRVAQPDLIMFDKLAHLIGADYNSSTKLHELMRFVYLLAVEHNAAVIIAAHPRKRGKQDIQGVTLRGDSEAFFEECMGSSHFINTTGSLWGLERDLGEERTYLLLGAQRLHGSEGLTALEKDDTGWFHPVSNYNENFQLACNSAKRIKAWGLLPHGRPFSFLEACQLVNKEMSSKSSVHGWWKELLRHRLILPVEGDKYIKAPTGNS